MITDEMVTAGAIAGNVTDEKAREIIEAALSVEARVKVKPLEWQEDSCGNWHGNSPIGDEFIQRWHSPGNERIEFEFEGVCHPTAEAAKAAAQADYSARILSALSVEQPTPQQHVRSCSSYSLNEVNDAAADDCESQDEQDEAHRPGDHVRIVDEIKEALFATGHNLPKRSALDNLVVGQNMTPCQIGASPQQHVAVPKGYALIPLEPTDEVIEAICQEHTLCHWPGDFDRTAQAIRRQNARDGYEIAIKLAALATTEGKDNG